MLMALLIGLLVVSPGQAAQRTADYLEMDLSELLSQEVFSAASLLPTEFTQAPGTAYRFDQRDFRRLGIRRLEDLFRFIPGFQVNQHRKRDQSVWARGILSGYNDKMLLLVDGVPDRSLYYGHFSLGDALALEQIEKVEIVLGPASSLYGANAFGGVIAVTTRGFSETPEMGLTTELGDNQRIKATLHYADSGLQLSATRLEQEAPFRSDRGSFYDGAPSAQELDEHFGALRIKLRPFEDLTLGLDYQHRESPFLFIPPTQDAFVESRPLTLSADYGYGEATTGRIQLNAFYRRDRITEYEIEQLSRQPAYRESQDAHTSGLTLTGFKALNGAHHLTGGLSWQQDNADDFSYTRWWHYRDGFLETPDQGQLISDPQGVHDDFALFVQDQWRLAEDLTLTLGGRQDRYDAFGEHTNYRSALVYSLDPRRVLKLLYGTAIRTPAYREYLKVLEDTDFRPPAPAPERLRTLELGYLHHWDQANLGVTLFRNEVRDSIHETPTPDGNDEYFTNSSIPWKMQGVEMLAQYSLGANLHLRLGLAYIDASAGDDGDLPYAADWSANANLEYRYAQRHALGLALFYEGEREDTNDFATDDPRAHWLMNLHGWGGIRDGLSYAFGIDNLLDERVFDPAADFGNRYNSERSGREIWVRLEWELDL